MITGAPDDMAGALRNLSRAKDTLPEGDAIDGFHVEGPHICAGRRTARRASAALGTPAGFRRVPPLAGRHRRPHPHRHAGAGVAGGAALYREDRSPRAWWRRSATRRRRRRRSPTRCRAGATLSTHLGNGAHSVLRRHPNYIWDQLAEDRLMADFIVDGIHLDASFLKVALRAKGIERSVLVTDAATPAGAAPGRYRLGEQDVDHTADGRVVLAGQDRLAGSALRMDRGVENLMRLCGLPLADAVRMATVNAARAGAVPGTEPRARARGSRRFRAVPPDSADRGDWNAGLRAKSVLAFFVAQALVPAASRRLLTQSEA